ncbi:MAG: SDR family NAD(P)-dependent oxidoreductase [Rhizobacter sp.]|nr:SDR family NAD(P)-dependent oxidoreductase [Bacteriovorax sp.]
MKDLIIITGASSGLGNDLAKIFLEDGQTVIGISRTNKFKDPNFIFFKYDLTKPQNLIKSFEAFFKKNEFQKTYRQVILINNAATILPINYFHKIKPEEILISCQLNLQTPMMLSHFIINKFMKKAKQVSICNISSGAADYPIINWSLYCTMKSGLKMFTQCLQADYADEKKFKAFSFYPGVMDTQMQKTIRKQSSKNFKNVEKFRGYKEDKKLLAPELVASKIYDLITSPEKINKTEYNVRDL